MSALIETSGLSRWFGEVMAVNNLTLTIEPGVTGLLGPNGAGKSTFLKLALGLYRPSRGTMRVLGEQPKNNKRVLQRIGYCPEKDSFYDHTTGYEFVYWLNRYWGMARRQAHEAAEAACDLVAMTERMHDPIDTYSKGMRQRIKVAQALAPKPELLFLDEPMAGLDPKGREEIFELIRRLGDAGCSVLFSSHILYEVERVTDSVIVLNHGSLLAHGRVREIRDLIDRHPHMIRIDCNEPRALAQELLAEQGVISLEIEPEALVIRTANPNACYERINKLALQNGHRLGAITCADDSLQAVFDYLME